MKEAFRWSWRKAVDRSLRLMVGTPGISLIALITGMHLAEHDRWGFVVNLAIVIFLIVLHEKDYLELQQKAKPLMYKWKCPHCDLLDVSSDNEGFMVNIQLSHMKTSHPEVKWWA